jgi:6-phosphogluconate dehydrogenase
MGPPGAGHYVKMIHNGIEYGMMQAYSEGFELLSKALRNAFGGHAVRKA